MARCPACRVSLLTRHALVSPRHTLPRRSLRRLTAPGAAMCAARAPQQDRRAGLLQRARRLPPRAHSLTPHATPQR